MKVEFIYFQDCPNHEAARDLLISVMREQGISVPITDIDATDLLVAKRVRFAGSPTIRVDDTDIEPGFVDMGDYSPRCRLYQTSAGLRGLPDRGWIEAALKRASRQ